MRTFYEEWSEYVNRQPAVDELNWTDFLRVPFTHHVIILRKVKDLEEIARIWLSTFWRFLAKLSHRRALMAFISVTPLARIGRAPYRKYPFHQSMGQCHRRR